MLTNLRLSRFRCYATLNWEIPAEGAILLGDNAQGKTGALEAICFALTLHSPRATRMDRLVQLGAPAFGISLETDEGTRRVVWENRKLSLRVQGAERRDYADYLEDAPPVTWMGNADMALVNGAAEDRRRFLDFLGAQWHPAYRAALQAYRKALKSRNALLRNPRRSRAALQSYADILATHGSVLVELRQLLLERLLPHVAQHHRSIAGGAEQIALQYAPSVAESLKDALLHSLDADEHAGYTTVGPHRDDFLLEIAGKSAANYASEGQQRTLAAALLLAHSALLQTETGHAPILLMDDIFGELDPARRKALLEMLPPEAQIFITTTHLDWLRDTPAPLPVAQVKNGQIAPM